jgi:hypothetical protein
VHPTFEYPVIARCAQAAPWYRPAVPGKLVVRPFWLVLGSLAAGALLAPACKKAAPPTPAPAAPPPVAARAPLVQRPDAAPISCPPESTFAPLAQAAAAGERSGKAAAGRSAKGRVLRTACTVLYEGFYWGAAALSYAEKGPARPSLHFLTGGPASRNLVFDIDPAPTQDLETLIRSSKQVGVTIRRSRGDRSLVRMGVTGQTGTADRPQSRELGLLLQLVAHALPRLLWWGPGDETSVDADGCLSEQTVDFELLFRTRLERFTTTRARRPAGTATAPPCAPASSMQENVTYQATSLKPPRPL